MDVRIGSILVGHPAVHPFLDQTELEAVHLADLGSRHAVFFDPVVDRVSADTEVFDHFLDGYPFFFCVVFHDASDYTEPIGT